MSEQKIRRAFRTTKIKINKETIPSSEQRDQLESLFINLEANKTDAVAADRVSQISSAKGIRISPSAERTRSRGTAPVSSHPSTIPKGRSRSRTVHPIRSER